MGDFRECSRDEFDKFISSYPRRLENDVFAAYEPPLVSLNDFERAPYWPDSVVASYIATNPPSNFRVLSDISAPVEDDGKRDTDTPLTDSNGAILSVGDQVDAVWGYGPPNSEHYGRKYGPDGRCVVRETINIRDLGTKYEHYSFESCHNIVRGFDMIKVSA